jgi:catechol 2,3-dioxygenase-like lactoylglutathione lyase family enzyme
MRKPSLRGLFVAAVLTITLPTAAPVAQTAPVRQVDHVMIRTGDPTQLFAFFVDVLQLPVAWPLMSPRAGVTTGGVSFGNVNVEAIQVPGQTDLRPQLIGFAFEPFDLPSSLSEMDRRGITYGPLRPVASRGPDGSATTLWTNVTLRQFSDSDGPADATVHIFVSEYSPAYVNVAARSARLRSELIAARGGPLGIEALKEIVIGVDDLESARALWQKLLAPTRPSEPGVWQIGDGPAVRLVAAETTTVQELVIRVASLQRARTFLREKGLLGTDSLGEATIDPSRLNGLKFRLVEAK